MDSISDLFALVLLFDSFIESVVSDGLNPLYTSIQLFIMLIGLVFSAVFSGSEVAFFSLANTPELLDEKENSYDRMIKKMLDNPRRLLATILIGNTFSNVVASVIAAFVTGDIAAYYGFPDVVVFTVEVVVLTFMILILSEITPKIVAINDPLDMSRRFGLVIHFFYILFKPFSKFIAISTISLEKYIPKPSSKMTSKDIIAMAEVSEQEGSIEEGEKEIIENIIEFGTTTAREIMTSRVNMIAVSVESSLEEIIDLIKDKGYSRMPLFEGDLDNIIGIVYAKDMLPYLDSEEEATPNLKSLSRDVLYIPSTKMVDDLLRDFQSEKTHIAIVVDEYGGTEGMVTMDDILEEIIGEFEDESDEGEPKPYRRINAFVYIFDAQIDLDDMEEVIDREITEDDDEFESLGGLIYHILERLPSVGERVNYKDMELVVQSVENNRIKKVRVKLLNSKKKEDN